MLMPDHLLKRNAYKLEMTPHELAAEETYYTLEPDEYLPKKQKRRTKC
jgi:hypothetical protein